MRCTGVEDLTKVKQLPFNITYKQHVIPASAAVMVYLNSLKLSIFPRIVKTVQLIGSCVTREADSGLSV